MLKKYLFNYCVKEKGQGLLETVIALSVIITGLTGALSLAISNLSSVSVSGNRVIAGNLAREGIEVVRNIRDGNWLYGCPGVNNCRSWDEELFISEDDHTATVNFMEVGPDGKNQWMINPAPNILGSGETRLRLNDKDIYNHMSGNITPFSRLLILDEICDDFNVEAEGSSCENQGKKRIGIRVISEVQWSERGGQQNLSIEDNLYNWK